MKYFINYNTGAGNETFMDTLEEAMAAADNGATYTQRPITIHSDEGDVVASRSWLPIEYDEEEPTERHPICLGNLGYYSDWVTF